MIPISTRFCSTALCLIAWFNAVHLAAAVADDGFRVPDGFEVTRFADDALAHDIFSMTLDPQGRVVVAGPGYIKTLHDDNDDGVADRASLFSESPKSGAQGLCFAGDELWATGDGALLRLRDANRDGTADGPGEVLAKLRSGEHGAHAILQGPDGWFYVVCGNDSGLSEQHINSTASPVTDPRCGGILRISPDGQTREVVAHGFRNPYDIDFTPEGQLLTVDSDGERDQHLPWYEPTRMFDVAQAMEHGWLDGGHTKSWSRPEYFFDNVDRVCEFGRGSPTGLTAYRHRQFPERYRGGAFAACWTFGRIYFVPLTPDGSTLRGQPEVFASTVGDNGFAPVDVAVGPRGDLFVAIGGRKTRGGVYRIRYADNELAAAPKLETPEEKLAAILAVDQPLSSWSRSRWIPLAKELGDKPFAAAAIHQGLPPAQRIRAIEVLSEQFGGLSEDLTSQIVEQAEPNVIARTSWSLARSFAVGKFDDVARTRLVTMLGKLRYHTSPVVQRAAWEALRVFGDVTLSPDSSISMQSDDRRVRAAMVACSNPGRWNLQGMLQPGETLPVDAARLRIEVQHRNRAPFTPKALATCIFMLDRPASAATQVEVLRCLQLVLGDIRTTGTAALDIPGYVANRVGDNIAGLAELSQRLSAQFPTEDDRVNREFARTFAMLRAAPPATLEIIAELSAAAPTASESLHYLFSLAYLPGERTPEATRLTADALARLHGKLAARREFPSRNWGDFVAAAFDRLVANDSRLSPAFVEHPEFGRPEQVLFLTHLPQPLQTVAARRLFERARVSKEEENWTSDLIDALRTLPRGTLDNDQVLAAVRDNWEDFRIRDSLALWLTELAQPEDRGRLAEALASSNRNVVAKAATALIAMPAPANEAEILAAMGALRQAWAGQPRAENKSSTLVDDKRTKLEDRLWEQGEPLRGALDQLLRHWARDSDDVPQKATPDYQAWLAWFRQAHPEQAQAFATATGSDTAAWAQRLAQIDWNRGNSPRGKTIFEKQSCHRCHRGDNRLGPELAGAAKRLTREDLFAAIYDPQREVAPPYRTTLIATRSGQVHHGLIIYESPEGTLLQTAPDTTLRITGDELLTMQPSNRSLMPTGLLDPLSDQDLADLWSYLGSLPTSEK